MRSVGFAADEIAAMEAGRPVVRVLHEADDNDANVLGVVRIAATEAALVDAVRHIATFESGPPYLQVGRFGTPPSVSDLRTLEIDPHDLDDLQHCRIGDCDLKVGGSTMALARRVDWHAPDARQRAARIIKEAIVQHVRRYLVEGSTAMAVYDDEDKPRSVASEFEKIVHDSPGLMRYNPEFLQYLLEFPRRPPPGVEDFFYWSQEKLRKPVVSVVHACIQRVSREGRPGYSIALKHIFDSHYFWAYVEFLTLVPAGDDSSGFYLLHDLRARLDPPHHFRGFVLGKVKDAMRHALSERLERVKRRLESRQPAN